MPEQITLPWDIAADRILAAAANLSGPIAIGITGPVGSGKTTLAQRLSPCIISTDHYLPDYDKVAYEDRDLPHASDLPGLAHDLRTLKKGLAADIPIWSFHTHRREGSRKVESAPVIICEGLHALHGTVAPHLDLRIFIDAPATVRWSRWENLERTGQRGWGVEVAREFFHTVAEPTFAKHSAAYRETADYVVLNG